MSEQLIETVAEVTRQFEGTTSGVLRHFQWHREMAAYLSTVLPTRGYSIIHTGTDESIELACEWSDYRKTYGVGTKTLDVEYKAFVAGWQAARGNSHEPGPVR